MSWQRPHTPVLGMRAIFAVFWLPALCLKANELQCAGAREWTPPADVEARTPDAGAGADMAETGQAEAALLRSGKSSAQK